MNEQLKQVRRFFQKTQNEFGKSLGVSRDTYASYESGRVVPKDTFVQLLCSVYNVNENWLATGNGEMLKETQNTFMDSLKVRFALDEIDVENVTVEEIERLLKIYLFIPKESREMALAILGGMAVSSNGGKQEEIFSLLIPRN